MRAKGIKHIARGIIYKIIITSHIYTTTKTDTKHTELKTQIKTAITSTINYVAQKATRTATIRV